jgi:hypothetical protein
MTEKEMANSAVLERAVMIALANRETRHWQTFTPQSAALALQENTAGRSADHGSPDIPGGPTYQRHARTGTVGD